MFMPPEPLRVSEMPKGGPTLGPVIGLPLIVLIVFAGIVVFLLPICPSLSVTFAIGHKGQFTTQPTIAAVTWQYAKVSLTSSSGTTKGQIGLSSAANSTTRPYTLTVTVSYNGQNITSATPFPAIGEGVYQVHVVYYPRSEQSTIPYIITFVVSGPADVYGIQPAILTVDVYPT
jgi:hypothetical protein